MVKGPRKPRFHKSHRFANKPVGVCSSESFPSRSYWMRESAQRADSARIRSSEAASRSRRTLMRPSSAVPGRNVEFPSAIQALRIRPRHLVRLTALPRNTSRKSASVSPRSHSSLGRWSDSSCGGRDVPVWFSSAGGKTLGWNCGIIAIGARRFHGQTSWQMSQPKT